MIILAICLQISRTILKKQSNKLRVFERVCERVCVYSRPELLSILKQKGRYIALLLALVKNFCCQKLNFSASELL